MDKHTREIMFSSSSDEYETPKELFDRLNGIFKFTIDPCASGLSHMLDNYWTIEDDGLTRDWGDHVPYINPPYSDCKNWFKKAGEHHLDSGKDVVLLTPVRSDTSYWHDYVWGGASYVLFLRGRLKFVNRMALTYQLLYRFITEPGMKYQQMLQEYKKNRSDGKEWSNPPTLSEIDRALIESGLEHHKTVERLLPPSSAPFPSAVVFYTKDKKLDNIFGELGKVIKIK